MVASESVQLPGRVVHLQPVGECSTQKYIRIDLLLFYLVTAAVITVDRQLRFPLFTVLIKTNRELITFNLFCTV